MSRRAAATMATTAIVFAVAAIGLAARAARIQDAAAASVAGIQLTRRINAHGDEFTSLALTSDATRLVVGTEKGDLIVWSVADRRQIKVLHQGSPVHAVAALSDPCCVLAVGGPHGVAGEHGVARKWDLDAGTAIDWPATGLGSFVGLGVDVRSGIGAATTGMALVAWDLATGALVGQRATPTQPVLSAAVSGRSVYFTTLPIAEAAKLQTGNASDSINAVPADHLDGPPRTVVAPVAGRVWTELGVSADGQQLAAMYVDGGGKHVAVLNAETGREIGAFSRSSFAWSPAGLVLFDDAAPVERVLRPGESMATSALLKSGDFHQAGTPSEMSGHVISPDGTKIWETFQLNAALVECDLEAARIQTLLAAPGSPFAMQVFERPGVPPLVVTGGDDGFVRVWSGEDLSLVREFPTSAGVPQGVAVAPDGKRVLFSFSGKDAPSTIAAGDLASGRVDALTTIPEPFVQIKSTAQGIVYNHGNRLVFADEAARSTHEIAVEPKLGPFAVSPNGEWVAAANDAGLLFCFEARTGKRLADSKTAVKNVGLIAVSNDGRSVYTTGFESPLQLWDTHENAIRPGGTIRGVAHALTLSSDGSRLAFGGNHRDIGVLDARTGGIVAYAQTSASDFYVTNVWVSGARVLFTTDAGILLAGLIAR